MKKGEMPSEQIQALLEAERAAPAPAMETQLRVFERVETSIGAGAGAGSAAATGGGVSAGTVTAVSLVVVAIGGGLLIPRGEAPPPVPPPPVEIEVVAPAPQAPAATPLDIEPLQVSEAPRTPAPKPPKPAPAIDPLAAELRLLRDARGALSSGDGERALRIAERHARRFPRGLLTEEREALRVQSLAALGRDAEAQAAAETFARRYPESMHLPAVRRAAAPDR